MSHLNNWFSKLIITLLFLTSFFSNQVFAHDQKENEYEVRLLAKAGSDECYTPLNVNPRTYIPMPGSGVCPENTVEKVNQAYVWGLAKTSKDLWLGTAPNVNCLVEGGFLGIVTPSENSDWVCEFGSSVYKAAVAPNLPDKLGDWRPSHIYRLPLNNGPIEDVTVRLSPDALRLLGSTIGLRSAGTHKGVVILAGPSMTGGINMFAFNANTNAFIGARNIPEYSNIRKWIVVKDEMYTTVGLTQPTGGALLKWTGSLADPWHFAVVGTLPSEGAELVEHNDHIYVATWPSLTVGQTLNAVYAGVFQSAKLPSKRGLDPSNLPMVKIWDVRDYEPDPVIAASYGGGALASFRGELVWGTMHVPGIATGLHLSVYNAYYAALQANQSLMNFAATIATSRAIAIFSKKDGKPTKLLYGQAFLPAFNLATGWTMQPNASGLTPILGPSGFGNPFNNYTWTMATSEHELFVGTMDWGYLLYGPYLHNLNIQLPLDGTLLNGFIGQLRQANLDPALVDVLQQNVDAIISYLNARLNQDVLATVAVDTNPFAPGADLMVFKRLDKPAEVISRIGVGNYLNYGLRTMIVDKDKLYIGTANPMNLRTIDGEVKGGWELLKMKLDD